MRQTWLPLAMLAVLGCNVLVGGDDLVFRDGAGGAATSSAATAASGLPTSSTDAASSSSVGGSGGSASTSSSGSGAGGEGGEGNEGGGGPTCESCLPVTALALGGSTCALLDGDADGRADRIRCWGPNESGQLGLGNTVTIGASGPPMDDVTVQGVDEDTKLAVGSAHACASVDGGLVCWGEGGLGQLGYGGTHDVGDTQEADGEGTLPGTLGVEQIVAGVAHTCARFDGGAVRCWGDGSNGRLGYASQEGLLTPGPGVALGSGAELIAAGAEHTCAVLDGGHDVRCWGSGGSGRLGSGSTNSFGGAPGETPDSGATIRFEDRVVLQIVAGVEHTCVRLDSFEVVCWGKAGPNGHPIDIGAAELVGDGTPAVAIEGEVSDLAAGSEHTCVVVEGKVRCWGVGTDGRLGYESEDSVDPMNSRDVDVGAGVVDVEAGARHTCARFENGAVRCWGQGAAGQLGYGSDESVGDDEAPVEWGPVQLAGG